MDIKYLRIASDLHLEAWVNAPTHMLHDNFLQADPRDAESILVLAGDISSRQEQLVQFLTAVSKSFAHVLYVPGNHEFYRYDYHDWFDRLKQIKLPKNVTVAFDTPVVKKLAGIRFILTTLWADGGRDDAEKTLVEEALNDFRLIQFKDKYFTVSNMISEHEKQKTAVEEELKKPFNGETVVVSHHMPSYHLCHPRFGNEINGGFASNCDDILAYDHAPALWIHGHTHDTISTKLWKTRIECNPAGYRGEWNTTFNSFLSMPVFIALSDIRKE